MRGIEFPLDKDSLTEETKSLISLMIQKNVDELSESDYLRVREMIVSRMSGNSLVLDNLGIVFRRNSAK